MKPIKFKEATKNLAPPDKMPEGEKCVSMWIWTNGVQCISCWNASFFQRLKFLFTGKIWVSVLSGSTQPPVWVKPDYPFNKD